MRMTKWQGFLKNESGVTAIEYALIASLIFLAIVAAVGGMVDQVGILFQQISGAL